MDKIIINKSDYGRYSPENKKWLQDHIGETFSCEQNFHNINYVTFTNGFFCHIYDGSER